MDRTISATFSINSYSLSVLAGNGGSVTGSGTFEHGSTATISATPETGYSFGGWSGSGVTNTQSMETTVDMSMDRNLSATFSINSYSLSVLAGNGGSVSGAGTFNHGIYANISATPETGYSFSGWSGSGITNSESMETTVDMSMDRTISATFSINSYSLSVLAGNGGSVTGSGTFEHGSTATISAIPNSGYSFIGWLGDGILDVNSTTTSVEMTQSRTISAIFSERVSENFWFFFTLNLLRVLKSYLEMGNILKTK